MSRLFEALRQSELERSGHSPFASKESVSPSDLLQTLESEAAGFRQIPGLRPIVRPHSRLVAFAGDHSLGAEKFRLLATRLKNLQAQRKVKKILVTSSVMQEGKSIVAANLAVTLARRSRQRVLLLEGDLRQPVLPGLLGVSGLKGLAEWLQSNESITKFFYRVADLQLWFLPAGTIPEQPLELLQSTRLSELLNQFVGWFDWVVIDSPPLLPLADANVWARLSDGILLVVREGYTPKKLLQKALGTLDNPTFLGLVLNESTEEDHHYYSHNYASRQAHKNSKNKQNESKAAS